MLKYIIFMLIAFILGALFEATFIARTTVGTLKIDMHYAGKPLVMSEIDTADGFEIALSHKYVTFKVDKEADLSGYLPPSR